MLLFISNNILTFF